MLLDLEEAATGTPFKSDVCVIGAGVMGLLLADKLARRGLDVHLMEGGGLELEPRSQEIYESEMGGAIHEGTTVGRFRTFGGSSTKWGGQLMPYPREVFESRSVVGDASWPISEIDFQKYYGEIFSIMGVNHLPFDDEFLRRFGAKTGLDTAQVRVRFSKFAPFSKRNLAKTVGKACVASPRITVFLHANAVSVDLEPGGQGVQGITVCNYKGGRHTFTAREYIICTGAIETSRLLLNSTGVHPAGVGNDADLVGRYFHDHLTMHVGSLSREDMPGFVRHFTPYYVKGTVHTPKLEATAALQKSLNLLNVQAHFFIQEPENSGFGLLRQALHDFQDGKLRVTNTRAMLQLPRLLGGAAKMAFAVKMLGRRFPTAQSNIALHLDTEQRPRADSRIRLSDQLDALGMRKAIVDWKCSAEEGEAIHRYASVVESYLKSLGMKQINWRPERAEGPQALLQIGKDIYHHMGGTRMGVTPRDSVVTRDLRLHGVHNLYVASCSTFPSGGSSGPTFTMMALALRLADLLAARIDG